jgi:hypothetical protein
MKLNWTNVPLVECFTGGSEPAKSRGGPRTWKEKAFQKSQLEETWNMYTRNPDVQHKGDSNNVSPPDPSLTSRCLFDRHVDYTFNQQQRLRFKDAHNGHRHQPPVVAVGRRQMVLQTPHMTRPTACQLLARMV